MSYFTVIIPFVMLLAKAALRCTHSFRVIDPREKLEKGITISEDTLSKIQRLLPKILRAKDDPEIEWLSTGNNFVFKLRQNSQFIFKIPCPWHYHGEDKLPEVDNKKTDERFSNMVKAKEVCLANQLGLLVIPRAKKIRVNAEGHEYGFIAEEILNIEAHESAQEQLYHSYSEELCETDRQLSVFVAKTGFNDVAWRNIPLLNEIPKYKGHRRVGLIDLEHMRSAEKGFTGDERIGSTGLVKCATSEEQIDAIIEEAHKQNIDVSDSKMQALKQARLKEIESYKQLHQFYERKGIKTGRELLEVDINTLGLDLTEESTISIPIGVENNKGIWGKETVTLGKVTELVIQHINKGIEEAKEGASVKGKRRILLNINKDSLTYYKGLGVNKFITCNTDEKKLWFHRIIVALIEKDHLFRLDEISGHGYFIQA